MQYIYDNCKDVESCSRQCLLTGVSLGNWLLQMNHKRNPGDELALFLLCKLFNRHAVVITKTGLWSTLCNTANEGELVIRAKCDICLILVSKGNIGFGEVIHVTPTKTLSKHKRQQKTIDVSVQQAVTQESQGKNDGGVTPNRHPKRKCITASISKLNILPESGKTHDTHDSNGTHTRHTSRQLRHTYKDINYKDMDVKTEDDESPPRKHELSVAACLRAPSFPQRRSQGIITRNRLQHMASPNTRAKLIGTAIKIEMAVKKEDEVKKEPIVNTRRSDRSWPKLARLVHLDRTPCSEECIANDHYGKYPDFPDDNTTEPRVMPSRNNAKELNIATNAPKATDCAGTCENTGNNITLLNNMPNKDVDHGTLDTGHDTLMEPNDFGVPTENLDADSLGNVDQVMPTNNDESVEEGLNLPDLGSKQPKPKPQAASMIDLPDKVVEVMLPEVQAEFGHDELTSDFLDNEIDNATVLGVNVAPVTDFAKEMAEEEGVDCDLELELENLTFLEEQNSKQKWKEKNLGTKNNQKMPKGGKPKGYRKQSNVTPNNMDNTNSTSDMTPACTTTTLGSPKGVWKTTKHSICKNYRPSHPQNYGCKVCGQLLPSRGKLNEHYRCNHPPVLCPVCKKTFSCPNT